MSCDEAARGYKGGLELTNLIFIISALRNNCFLLYQEAILRTSTFKQLFNTYNISLPQVYPKENHVEMLYPPV
jgi:hypothetical protein